MAESAKNKEDFSDLIQRFVESLAAISDRLPFEIDRKRLHSVTTFAALSVAIIFAWKLLRAPPENHRRQPRRRTPVSGPSGVRLHSSTTFSSPEICSSSGDSKALDAVDELFRPVKLTLEQLVRHKLSEGRKVVFQLAQLQFLIVF
ncbi:peroxisome biogenesis protein 22-like [Asparagus officinalis]|uniref:peroxisome biogenesis protein 22-like n=1 Tax=Asparagus officinalis TaxID=4686 RepID=UPI00098E1E2F|nr:peroxisome biogenesis protein 22-like [Asparagus officinalis]